MSPLEINVAIAKEMGMPYHRPTEKEKKSGSYYQYEPDYCLDLNLMHSAENILNKDQLGVYEAWLGEVIKESQTPHACLATGKLFKYVHSTAAQRAEAFLKTIGKWVDNEEKGKK